MEEGFRLLRPGGTDARVTIFTLGAPQVRYGGVKGTLGHSYGVVHCSDGKGFYTDLMPEKPFTAFTGRIKVVDRDSADFTQEITNTMKQGALYRLRSLRSITIPCADYRKLREYADSRVGKHYFVDTVYDCRDWADEIVDEGRRLADTHNRYTDPYRPYLLMMNQGK
jgi:hypothetical protein